MNPPTNAMYDAPLDTPTQVAWIVLAATALLLAARAVRVELRAARAGARGARPRARTAGARAVDVGLDVAVAVAVLGLLGCLAAVVLAVFG